MSCKKMAIFGQSWICLMLFFAPVVSAKDNPYRKAKGPATIVRTNGHRLEGNLNSLSSSAAMINVGGRSIKIECRYIREIHTRDDVLTYDPKTKTFDSRKARQEEADRIAAEKRRKDQELAYEMYKKRVALEAKRSGKVRIVNHTNQTIGFRITSMRDEEGNTKNYSDGSTRSHLSGYLSVLAALSDAEDIAPESLTWEIKPMATVILVKDGRDVITSKVEYVLTNSDGSRAWQSEKKSDSKNLEIAIRTESLHTPVLVKVGDWQFEQDVWYSTESFTTPTTIQPVKKFWTDELSHYEVYGGKTHHYEKKHMSGTATAWADIENPTNQTLEVSATIEFLFSHLLLSSKTARGTITIPPRSKQRMIFTVGTKALVGNRRATGVRQLDITTHSK